MKLLLLSELMSRAVLNGSIIAVCTKVGCEIDQFLHLPRQNTVRYGQAYSPKKHAVLDSLVRDSQLT